MSNYNLHIKKLKIEITRALVIIIRAKICIYFEMIHPIFFKNQIIKWMNRNSCMNHI